MSNRAYPTCVSLNSNSTEIAYFFSRCECRKTHIYMVGKSRADYDTMIHQCVVRLFKPLPLNLLNRKKLNSIENIFG